MGNYIIRHENIDEGIYALLARDKQSYYLPSIWLESDFQNAISQFKHAVYTYALKLGGFDDYKCIYLYDGNERIAKCHIEQDRLLVSFISEDIANAFDKCDEKLPPGERVTAWLDRKFYYHYGTLSGGECDRRWINLGRSGYNT